MDIIHAVEAVLHPRLVTGSLEAHLGVMPAVVVTGARQTGKSTLVRELLPGTRRYLSLDDLDTRDVARRDPQALVGHREPVILDEIQREPQLLLAVKQAIDERRQPGRFVLTGSAGLLLMQRASESLAGRASYLTLWPMTRREQLGLGTGGIWSELLAAPDDEWPELLAAVPSEPADWRSWALRGGFPTPALELADDAERAIWFDGYVRTYLERDLQDLSSVAALPDFRRLMRAACLRLGQIVNQTDLGRDVALSQSTVHRYLNLLETSHLLVRVAAYSVNRTKRLIKSPKLYWGDTGLALRLAQQREPTGACLENLVLCDLLAWRETRTQPTEVMHWRTAGGAEVDFIVETQDRLLPIEVKATTRPRLGDARHLRTFNAEYAGQTRIGLLVYGGDTIEWLAPDVLAVPWWRVI